MKAKEEKVAVKYSHIGKLEDFTVEVFANASLGNIESKNETKSVMGMFIALRGKGNKISPLHWKAKVINKVAQDIKSAETISLENAVDDSIHLSDMIVKIYTGSPLSNIQIPWIVNEDLRLFIENFYSTKQ